MDRFESMSTFVAVVEAGGFSAASRQLCIPLSTVSRKVSELEDHLKVRLLNRSTRQINLTERGREFYESCRHILDEVTQAERIAIGEYESPKGELVITAPIAFGQLHVTPVVVDFLKNFPEVDVRLVMVDSNINLLEERIDLAIRIGELPDSSLIARRIGNIHRILCASPAYLANRGTPQHPQELIRHDCITMTELETANEWPFKIGRKLQTFPVRSRLVTSTAISAVEAAFSGLGITRVLSYQASEKIVTGDLKRLMTDYEPDPCPVNFVYPSHRFVPAKLSAFLNYASPFLQDALSSL